MRIVKLTKYLCLLWLLGISIGSHAQKKYELTVQQAVDMAFNNLADVKNAQLDYRIQEEQNKGIEGQLYPQLSGSAGVQYYIQTPKILFPDASQAGIYDVLIKEHLLPDGTQIPTPKLQALSFYQPWNSTFGATLSQLLFQPDVFVGLQARKASLQYAQSNIEQVKEQVKDSAYKKYYAILVAGKQLYFLNESIKRLEKLYHDDSALYANGFAEKLDLDKVQVQLTNLKTTASVVQTGLTLSYAALKFSIGVSQQDTVVLKDSLSIEEVKKDVLNDSVNYSDRPIIRTLDYSKKLSQLDVRRYKLQYLPSVAAQASYAINSMGNKFITDPTTVWLKTSYVGLNVSIPIFDGFQKRANIRQAQLRLQKLNNTYEQVKQGIDLEVLATKESFTNSLLQLDMQERNRELAQKVYNTTKIKFEQGLGSSFEVLQADTEFQTAEANYFNALYNAIVAKISYQKAIGKLP
ncbi:TolC family protein [Ilyomonas limi]|nr:TolC family protein [Ilyomonas limi]